MATVVIAIDGSRINDSTVATNWSKVGISGPSPASEAQLAYQGGSAVNVKNTNTGSHGGLAYDPGSGAIDMTSAAYPLVFLKIYVADFGALDTADAVRARVGSASTAYYYYIVAGTNANRSVFDAYPAQGGYILVAINPNISAWREGTQGSPSLSTVDYFAGLALFTTGGAKSENFAVDAIDAGRGLLLTRGDAGSTEGNFTNFVTSDQNTTSNRWGVVYTRAGAIFSIGRLTIGESGTATEFTDDGTSLLIFPDGYHGPGNVGVYCDINNASSIILMNASTIIGRGSATTSDTRPDFTVAGTSGTFTMDGTILTNHRNVTFTSVCDVTNADIDCSSLVQSSANISDSVIRTDSATSVACLTSPTFGTTTDLRDTEFIQEGSGHAIELPTATTYNLQGLTFTGYGANASDSAALDITASSGTVTLNLSSMATPTYKTAGATVVINNNKTVTLTGLPTGVEVRVYNDTGSGVAGTEINGIESTVGSTFNFSAGAGAAVIITIFDEDYAPIRQLYTVPANDAELPYSLITDGVYLNP